MRNMIVVACVALAACGKKSSDGAAEGSGSATVKPTEISLAVAQRSVARVEQHEIGEGAADIDADAEGCRGHAR